MFKLAWYSVLGLLAIIRYGAGELSTADLKVVAEQLDTFFMGPLLPTAVRLAFHDCVGGCNGCVNLSKADNKGLEGLVNMLDKVYVKNNFSSILSRADYWAYAGQHAIMKTVDLANEHCGGDQDCMVPDPGFEFKFGRIDCPTAPYGGEEEFPSSHFDYTGVKRFFEENFNFTMEETVALLGAHTLGRAKSFNSGFEGVWVPDGPEMMNNDYYKLMVNHTMHWVQSDMSPNTSQHHYQWTDTSKAFMLNTDLALLKNITVDEEGRSSCEFSSCQMSPTADLVMEFSKNNSMWIHAFSQVFTKMQEHGSTNLRKVREAVETTAATSTTTTTTAATATSTSAKPSQLPYTTTPGSPAACAHTSLLTVIGIAAVYILSQ